MTCYSPLTAYRGSIPNAKTGAYPIKIRAKDDPGGGFPLPCGQCMGCRLDYSGQWATRIMHEASLQQDNCFITLTYNDTHLPSDKSLDKRDFQLFAKKLRKKRGFRYFHAGEYSEPDPDPELPPVLGRPHYHACMFGITFPDAEPWRTTPLGDPLYLSEELSETWGKGYVSIGRLTFESAAYVARYVCKKITGDKARRHYAMFDPISGLVSDTQSFQPEYCTMSRMPGIGQGWYKKWKYDVYPDDCVTIRNRNGGLFTMRTPRYYDGLYTLDEPIRMERIKEKRKQRALDMAWNATPERLSVRKAVKEAQIAPLTRGLG